MNNRTRVFPLTISLLLCVAIQRPLSAELRTSHLPYARGPVSAVPAPEDVLGFRPGDDRKLASWASVIEYFKRLDAASDRVKFEELGRTTMDAPLVMATISAPENLRRLNEYKEIQRRLADPRTLGPNPDSKARALIARGKTIVLITCGIHSDEVGSYLSSMLIAHRLASSDDPEIQEILRNTIVLLVPSLNPDGVDIVKNWYDRTLGTPYEGTDPPVLYHKYTGHDDNRDWYAFTQKETQITVDKIHNVWHPQIVHDIHQMGAYGARMFLPPYMQPVEPNVPKKIVEGYTELGHAIAADMRGGGFKGITSDSIYDAWSPSRAYSHYHGGVRILSEVASCKIATPITVKFDQLRDGKNYDPRKASANFPDVWPGGEWHLRDITNYMTTGAFALLKHAAQNRERWLTRFYEIGKEAVRPRKKGELWGFRIASGSRNAYYLEEILRRGGVEVLYTKTARGVPNESVVRMDRPYGGFAKALLVSQLYPDQRDAAGHPIAPYDVTAHTLPLLMGVQVEQIHQPVRYMTRKVKGFAYMYGRRPCGPRVAIYQSHVPANDQGWTNWVLGETGTFSPEEIIRPENMTDRDIRAHKFQSPHPCSEGPVTYEAIIIPDQSPKSILEGHKKGTMPDEYTGGLGVEGVKALREFAEQGGTLIFLNRASDFAIEQFKLPVRDVTEGLKRREFYVPGSILRIELDTSHPIAKGMPKESIAWAEESPVFEIKSDPLALSRVHVIARYPENSDPLLSGWLLGGDRIRGKAALVEVELGKGRIYLFGFRPQYRGQSLATFPLLFNAIGQTR